MYIDWRTVFQTTLPGMVPSVFPGVVLGLLVTAASAAVNPPAAHAVEDVRSAVVLMYHRFGEQDLPSTNIKLDQFRAHLAVIEERGQPVLPLAEMMARIEAGETLPDRSLAITVDDAYRSFMTEAWPLLKARGYPVTLFVSTDPVDEGHARYLSWDEIRQLRDEGVTIGHHGAAHLNMVDAGVEASRADLRRATARFEAELGERPDLFAYPYGEFSLAIRDMIEAEGFKAAMAQHSGGIHTGDDVYTIPRFALNERYGGADRFRMISQVRALHVTDAVPPGPVIADRDKNPPVYGFTVVDGAPAASAFNCFSSHQSGRIEPKVLGGKRVEIRYDRPMPAGRHRTTCTVMGEGGRWYWHGKFFYVPAS
ncbi:hypothetical protein CCR85_11775 [Rhodothalassium salexigens]|uniref:polysaccharide deacetylase family protein n=1 Tax=Rhodothalassium salexigens TaxID=1086 RepID=UPI0019134C51|nr:polysaccharide deacetylase family protein [Rhodothalassium salexigens]MBK5912167.1 hypothetical protein [Rhodothalassium salexigens]MBK5921847.1 hypothetical protein [Rhodothalassium salexigens]